ncbi:MAG: hypothetical protein IT379_37380 [Deltaproteobacteria bacterium]|nr:hypothetical protein [Deltaproteobacteria bacterium]
MSFDSADGEPIYGYSEKVRRARKEHRCSACCETISPGQHYTYVSFVVERTAESLKRCTRCEALYRHLRELGRGEGLQPDMALNCGLSYEEEWGELPGHIAALAFVLPGEPIPEPR